MNSVSPSVIKLNNWAQYYVNTRFDRIGSWFIGMVADMFLLGILTVQFFTCLGYWWSSPTSLAEKRSDRQEARSQRRGNSSYIYLAVLLYCLSILKSVDAVKIVWDIGVQYYADPDNGVNLLSRWWHYCEPLFTAIIGLITQLFFIHRHYFLTRRLLLSLAMITGSIASLSCAIVSVICLSKIEIQPTINWITAHFACGVVVDSAITISLSQYLWRAKRGSMSTTTQSLLTELMSMMWRAAAPCFICISINLGVVASDPSKMTHIIFNSILAKLYPISAFYTIIYGHRIVSKVYDTPIPTITGFSITPPINLSDPRQANTHITESEPRPGGIQPTVRLTPSEKGTLEKSDYETTHLEKSYSGPARDDL